MMITLTNLAEFFAVGSVGILIGAGIVLAMLQRKRTSIKSLEEIAQKSIHEAKSEAERIRRDAIAQAKQEQLKRRAELELDAKRRRAEIQILQDKTRQQKESLDHAEQLFEKIKREYEHKERSLSMRLDALGTNEEKVNKLYATLTNRLETISNLTRDEARKVLFETLENEAKLASQVWIKKIEDQARETAKQRSIDIVITAMQRYLTEQVTLHSASVVHLPNEEIKGKIIGKEGRNIRALEMATGMEFIVGDAPEIITISGFNPIRREIAKRTLTKLVQDGRINPTRIEEVVEQCEKEMDEEIQSYGKQALFEFGLHDVHPEIVTLVGKLNFRTSYTQNVLVHSQEVAHFAALIAAELGLDPKIAARCGLLHDIGKAVTAEIEGPHAAVGAQLAKQYGEDPIVVNAIAAHLEEAPYESTYAVITHLADAISASRPGARRETLAAYIKRLEQLEEIARSVEGVKKSFALQAGREIRVIVDESLVDDEKALIMARELARRIEQEMNFPGQIKVNVIRESRAIEYAR